MTDADRASPEAMVRLESDLADLGIPLLCCPTEPEEEIDVCFGYRHSMNSTWEGARSHPRMKEEMFQQLLREVSRIRRATRPHCASASRRIECLKTKFRSNR